MGNLGDLHSYGAFRGVRLPLLVLEKKMPLLLGISVSELLGWPGGFVWLVVFKHTLSIFCHEVYLTQNQDKCIQYNQP